MIEPGLSVVITDMPEVLRGARAGLIANPASVAVVNGQRRHAVALLAEHPDLELIRLFGPEHGLYGLAHEGETVGDTVDERSGLPVVSLYGQRRAPELEHLQDLDQDLDALIFDLQDVGVRAYTYLSTLKACLLVCAEADIPLVVLDRPNPLGRKVFGPGLLEAYTSFVGAHQVRFGHGMTMGELARFIARDMGMSEAIHVVKMRGWQGEVWTDTGLPWVPPSPNLPSFEHVQLYPATVFIEGTNLSEGRGTHEPFRQVGAPWLDGERLADTLNAWNLPGVTFAPTSFFPTRSKHQGQAVSGVSIELQDWLRFDPLQTAFALISEARRQAPAKFSWLRGSKHPFVDLLFGSSNLRLAIDNEGSWSSLEADIAKESIPAPSIFLYPQEA